jgi:hypothetical protein
VIIYILTLVVSLEKDIVLPTAQHVFDECFFSKTVQNMKVKFDMTTRQTIVRCTKTSHAQDFVLAIHIDAPYAPIEIALSSSIASWLHYFLLMRFVMFVARRT